MGREGKGREGKGREGKGREGKTFRRQFTEKPNVIPGCPGADKLYSLNALPRQH